MKALDENPPNLKKFSSGGVGLMKADLDMSEAMPASWRKRYTNVEVSLSNLRHGITKFDQLPQSLQKLSLKAD